MNWLDNTMSGRQNQNCVKQELLSSMIKKENVTDLNPCMSTSHAKLNPVISICDKPQVPQVHIQPKHVPFNDSMTRHYIPHVPYPQAPVLSAPNLTELLISSSYGIPRPTLPMFRNEWEKEVNGFRGLRDSFIEHCIKCGIFDSDTSLT